MLRHLPPLAGTLLAAVLAAPAADAQPIYKWTDEHGEVHYTQFPSPEHNAEKLHAAPESADGPDTTQENLQKQLDTMEQQNTEKLQGAKDAEQWAEIQKLRRNNCKTAHKNLVNLNRGQNVRYVGPNGKIMRLTDEERQKRIEDANKQIKENCEP